MIIAIAILIIFIVFTCWCICDLFIPNSKKNYEMWKKSVQKFPRCVEMNREQIISIYQINPSIWECDNKNIYYYVKDEAGCGEKIIAIYTPYKDYKWLIKEIKNYEENKRITRQNKKEAKSLELIIENVQKEINRLNTLSNKEIKEASNTYNRVVKNIVKWEEP